MKTGYGTFVIWVALPLLCLVNGMRTKSPGENIGVRSSASAHIAPNGEVAEPPVTRDELTRLHRRIDQLEMRVSESRKDIDVQFARLAEVQAVIDRMQFAGRRRGNE